MAILPYFLETWRYFLTVEELDRIEQKPET